MNYKPLNSPPPQRI